MTPKEKAKELVEKFIFIDNGERFQIISITDELRAIQCALIAVDEIFNFIGVAENENIFWINYWQEVKQEIEKL